MSHCRALFPWLPFAVALRSVTNVSPRQVRGSAACHLWAREGQAPENCPVSLSLKADGAGSRPDNAGREGALQPDSADPAEPRQPETIERERSQPESRAGAWCPVTWLLQRSQGTLTEGSKLHVGQAVTADRGGSGEDREATFPFQAAQPPAKSHRRSLWPEESLPQNAGGSKGSLRALSRQGASLEELTRLLLSKQLPKPHPFLWHKQGSSSERRCLSKIKYTEAIIFSPSARSHSSTNNMPRWSPLSLLTEPYNKRKRIHAATHHLYGQLSPTENVNATCRVKLELASWHYIHIENSHKTRDRHENYLMCNSYHYRFKVLTHT